MNLDSPVSDQHIDRMIDDSLSSGSHPRHFDARKFGQEIQARREAFGYSTRRMAREVGVSQAYVVALEGSRSSRDSSGPCPTVEVLVGFARALGLHPVELLKSSLRQAGPHVLLVTGDSASDPMGLARSQFATVDAWLSAGEDAPGELSGDHLDLHPDGDGPYRLQDISAALQSGLTEMRATLEGRSIGLVFAESDATLLGSTEAVLEAERHWHQMVSRSVWAVKAEPAATVCTYDLGTIRRMADPLAASLDLIQSHDDIYVAKGQKTSRGRTAAMRLLQNLRPTGTRAAEWRRACANHLDQLTAA